MIATALIVGAGIGGLSAGVALQRAGWRVRIFERAPSPRELGFGLALAPNAMAALRELGVADAVKSQSAEPRRAEARRPDGTVLKRVELPPGALGGPTVVALRPALHGALLAARRRRCDRPRLHGDGVHGAWHRREAATGRWPAGRRRRADRRRWRGLLHSSGAASGGAAAAAKWPHRRSWRGARGACITSAIATPCTTSGPGSNRCWSGPARPPSIGSCRWPAS